MFKMQTINERTLLLWQDHNHWDGTLQYINLDALNDNKTESNSTENNIIETKRVMLSVDQLPINIQQITDTIIAVCGYFGMSLWDITTQQRISHSFNKRIILGAMYWDDKHILCWDIDGNIMLWDIINTCTVKEIRGIVPSYYESGDSPPFLVLKEMGYLILWGVSLDVFNIHTDQWLETHELFPHSQGINSACLLHLKPNNNHYKCKENQQYPYNSVDTQLHKILKIVTCGNDNTVKVQTLDGSEIITLYGHQNDVTGVIALGDNRVLSWSFDNTIRVWDAQSARMLYLCTHHSVGVSQVWSLEENWVLSMDISYNHIIWHIETGEIRHQFRHSYSDALLFSNACFITTSATGKMTMWDLQTGIATYLGGLKTSPDLE